MARVCPITGKKPSRGHNVSHSQRKTIKVWNPNLIVKKIFDESTGKMVKSRISAKALKNKTKDLISKADSLFDKAMKKKAKA